MTNYYKYLPTSPADETWGLYVLSAGCNRINKLEAYPPPAHPTHHYFDWNKGRIFDEFQIIYILNGQGTFESQSCKQCRVEDGSIILLFPNEWHRYKPDEQTGWEEHWVGFKGEIAENLKENHFIHPSNALLKVGSHESIVKLLSDINEKAKCEKPGYQQLISGAVFHLLGQLQTITRQGYVKHDEVVASVINKAKEIFMADVAQELSIENVLRELNVSYSWFRKAFKDYSGIAPHQYLLQLKIEKAKLLLSDPSKSIKEIAYSLKFETPFYFSKLFKKKIGLSPERYRKNVQL